MKKIPCFSLKAALFASVPNFILAALLFVAYLLAFPFKLAFANSVYAVLHIILALFEAMYVGLFSIILEGFTAVGTQSLVACCLYAASSLPMILVSVIAYRLGEKNVYLFGKRTPKKGSDD